MLVGIGNKKFSNSGIPALAIDGRPVVQIFNESRSTAKLIT